MEGDSNKIGGPNKSGGEEESEIFCKKARVFFRDLRGQEDASTFLVFG